MTIMKKCTKRIGNDLKEANRKFTEYILIGTLLSFGFAIACGILLKIAMSLPL